MICSVLGLFHDLMQTPRNNICDIEFIGSPYVSRTLNIVKRAIPVPNPKCFVSEYTVRLTTHFHEKLS